MRVLSLDLKDIEEAIRGPRDAPLVLQAYASTALPDPAGKWANSIIALSDLGCPAFSDGADWFPITLGAAL